MSTYAEVDDLTARLSSAYTVPTDAEKLLAKASELIDYATLGRAEVLFLSEDEADDVAQAILADAACDQVEYWLETGEEHDVLGLHGFLQGGRVQVQNIPGYLGQRTLRQLIRAGLYYAGANAR